MSESSFECIVYGQVHSKANSRKFAKFGSRMVSIKSDAARLFERQAIMQLKAAYGRRAPLKGELVAEVTIFYPDQRRDLDASLVLDCLQKAGVVVNDRQFREQHLYHGIDKEKPRAEIAIWSRQ